MRKIVKTAPAIKANKNNFFLKFLSRQIDKNDVKNVKLSTLFFICLSTILFSCGQVNTDKKKTYVNALGQQCACDSSYSPVCETSNKVSYDNKCVASCFNALSTTPGNCVCKTSVKVCAKSKYTGANVNLNECDAIVQYMEFGREQIVSYSACTSR